MTPPLGDVHPKDSEHVYTVWLIAQRAQADGTAPFGRIAPSARCDQVEHSLVLAASACRLALDRCASAASRSAGRVCCTHRCQPYLAHSTANRLLADPPQPLVVYRAAI